MERAKTFLWCERAVAIARYTFYTRDYSCIHDLYDRVFISSFSNDKVYISVFQQVVPHRSEQPYLMAGFPVKLQERNQVYLNYPMVEHLKSQLVIFPL